MRLRDPARPDVPSHHPGFGWVLGSVEGVALDHDVPEASGEALVEVAPGQVQHGRRVLASA